MTRYDHNDIERIVENGGSSELKVKSISIELLRKHFVDRFGARE